MPDPWEACFTLGTQWQFKPTNEEYKSVKAPPDTTVKVLGHDGRVLEYAPKVDPSPRFKQTADGLRLDHGV